MQQTDRVHELIKEAIAEINEGRDQPLPDSPDTILYGNDGQLDSLDLVRLVVSFEQRLATAFQRDVSLTDERAMSQKNSPFRSVESLAAYATSLLEETAA